MADTTPNLSLPQIAAAQAQKHVTHNEALAILDAVVQAAVADRDLTAPPVSPAEGQRWIVKPTATGDWAGHNNAVALWDGGAWNFYVPKAGWLVYVLDEGALVTWSGSAWINAVAAPTSLNNMTLLGVGTTADATNPLSAKLNNALFTAKGTGEGGDGNLRYKLNKEASANTLSLLFQDGYSGRAEIGLTGDDDFHFKVSPDGSTWNDALVLNRTSGRAKVKGLTDANSGAAIAPMIFTPGGDGVISIWRVDDSSGQNPRTATISSVASDVITLTTTVAATFFYQTYMAGVSYIRVWNTSKTPVQSAWVKAQPANNQLQVLTAADITTWAAGETVQVGDPTAITPNRAMAIDISPMLRNLFGTEFRQSGIMVRGSINSSTALDKLDMSATGISGSFVNTAQTYITGSGNALGVTIISCSALSPVSNSNLVFLRETISSTAINRSVSSLAVFA